MSEDRSRRQRLAGLLHTIHPRGSTIGLAAVFLTALVTYSFVRPPVTPQRPAVGVVVPAPASPSAKPIPTPTRAPAPTATRAPETPAPTAPASVRPSVPTPASVPSSAPATSGPPVSPAPSGGR